MQRLTFLALACAASQAALLSRGRGGRGGNGDGAAAAPFDGLELGDTSLAAAFAEADLNADGNLDRAEVVALWVDYEENAILETPRNCKQIKRIVKRFDLDDVQGLNLDEFSNLVDYVYVEPEEGDEDAIDEEEGDIEIVVDEGEILDNTTDDLDGDEGADENAINGGGAYGG